MHFLNVNAVCTHANPQEMPGKRRTVQVAIGSWETVLCATCKGSEETTGSLGFGAGLGAIGRGMFLDKGLPIKELGSTLGKRSPA